MSEWISAHEWAKKHSEMQDQEFNKRSRYLTFLAYLMEQPFAHGGEEYDD